MHPVQLSKADTKVLAQVFDPESAPTRAEVVVDPSLPQDRHVVDRELLATLRSREREAISIIEQCESSKASPSGKNVAFDAAMAILDGLLQEHPSYASARNNRAQLRRWRFGDHNTLCQRKTTADPQRVAAGSAAVRDLEAAIELASPERPTDAVSPGQGRLLAQSYTQLGALYYAAFKDLSSASGKEVVASDLSAWHKDRFEEEASRLFYLGGLYGNEVAKALAVHTNPHAKLCGSIVKEAMRKELSGTMV